jgi:hypothetical protein
VLQAWIVKGNLETLQEHQNELIAAIVKKVNKGNKPLVKVGANIISKEFKKAIAVYEGD